MRRRKLNRRRSALRWLAALLALVAFIWTAEVHCFTPGQALRKMARQRDLGELQLLETMNGELFEDSTLQDCEYAYILQNQGLTCLAFSTYDRLYGWGCRSPEFMEHGEQISVPVDFLMDSVTPYTEDGSLAFKPYVLGSVLDPAVESVELRLKNSVQENDTTAWVVTETVSLSREEWGEGPHYDYFFYMFDPTEASYWLEMRALDKNGNPITWTDLEGNRVEWYDYGWYKDFYDDWWNHLNGARD